MAILKQEMWSQVVLFYKQRSHALFGTVNMAQHWRHTYDLNYGKESIHMYWLLLIFGRIS